MGWIVLCAALLGSGDPAAAEAASAAENRHADIAAFRREFFEVDRSYSPRARAAATARLDGLAARAATIDPVGFELELARIAALADNGHTNAAPGPRSRRHNRVGIRLVPFGEEFYVVRALADHADLLGARLVAIDGRPLAELRESARALVGGRAGYRDRFAGFLLESPEQLHALGAIAAVDAATYRFAGANGANLERLLEALPPDPAGPRVGSERWLFPEPLDGEADGWRAYLPVDRTPWALTAPAKRFRWRALPEIEALLIELRQNHDAPGQPIAQFLGQATREIRVRKPRHLVLDMRFNGGGDLNTTRDFVERLPTLVPGRIFVLTSSWTFSAAISTVGYLKQAAPDRVTIVGEPVGDRLVFFAEGSRVTLSHSGTVLSFATERHDYAGGCRGFDDCHGPVVRHPIAVPTLDPEIPAPWTIDTYREGRDPALEAVAAALREG